MRISDWSSDVCSSDLAEGISIDWLLETHAHADHLSAAPWLQKRLGGAIAIGEHIRDVQAVFGDIFNAGADFRRDGSDFDRLWSDGDRFAIGELPVTVLHAPGHTQACVAYAIGDLFFVAYTMRSEVHTSDLQSL